MALDLRESVTDNRSESGRPGSCRDGRDGVDTTLAFSVKHGCRLAEFRAAGTRALAQRNSVQSTVGLMKMR